MDKTLERLLGAFGVSGHEEDVRNVVKDELKVLNIDFKEDKMGNIIVKLGSGSEKLMFSAHMDEIGVITTFIEDSGFLRIGSIGDFYPADVVHNFVRFENGAVGKIASTNKKDPEIGDIFIDLGLNGREEVLKKVKEGDVASFLGDALEVEKNIISPSLDNRVGCYILLKMIKEIKDFNKETYFVFSTQQQLGGRGARAAAFAIEPDYCVVLDLEDSDDYVGGPGRLKLGNGPVLTVMDKTLIMHHEVKKMLENSAEKEALKLQYTISTSSTEGGNLHKEKSGVKTGVVSIPCRYHHSISEMVCTDDIDNAVKLLKGIV